MNLETHKRTHLNNLEVQLNKNYRIWLYNPCCATQPVKQFPWDFGLSPGENVKIPSSIPSSFKCHRTERALTWQENNTQQGVPKSSIVWKWLQLGAVKYSLPLTFKIVGSSVKSLRLVFLFEMCKISSVILLSSSTFTACRLQARWGLWAK